MTITMKITKELIEDAKRAERFKHELAELCRKHKVKISSDSSEPLFIETNKDQYTELVDNGSFPHD